MASGLSGAASTSQKIRKNSVEPEKYTLLDLRTKWLISPLVDAVVVVDRQAEHGATHEQWTAYVRKYVRMKQEQLEQQWGVMARCDWLNWCEKHLPVEKRPMLFDSQEEALAYLEEIRKNSVEPKITEIFDQDKEEKHVAFDVYFEPNKEDGNGVFIATSYCATVEEALEEIAERYGYSVYDLVAYPIAKS